MIRTLAWSARIDVRHNRTAPSHALARECVVAVSLMNLGRSMDETETDVLYDKNGKAGLFLTDHPFLCLTGTIFEDTEAGLHDVSRRVIKLFRFVGGVIEEQYDDNRQSEGKADTGRNEKQADRVDRNGAQGERERQWELRKLRHINLELYHQIGDLLRIKLQVLDALERIKMAQLERSEKNWLRATSSWQKEKMIRLLWASD
jgi:hypothetical protein